MKLATRAAIAASILAYFLWFAGAGIHAPFSIDDLMNLHGHLQSGSGRLLRSSIAYWSGEYRPIGGLFYTLGYALFGFDPLPFRIGCFILLGINLLLIYVVAHLLTGSREIAVLAALIASYHAWFVDLYYSTGTVYDLLCFLFYFAALALYISIRQTGRRLRRAEWAAFLVLYICALDSKEMAATLPLAVGIYEWIYLRPKGGPRALPRWFVEGGRAMLITALLTIPYVVGKLTGSGLLATNPAYRPEISLMRYLHAFHLYLNVLFYQDHAFRSGNTAIFIFLLLGLALWMRSRPMVFAWCFVLFSVLPFIFIAHYSGFFMYLPMAGWGIYAATLLVRVRERVCCGIARAARPHPRAAIQAATFVALAAALAPLHTRQAEKTMRVFRSVQPPVTEVTSEFARVQPHMPPRARVLFLNDTFPDRGYWLLFLTRLYYHDLAIEVTRAGPREKANPAASDVVLAWSGTKLSVVDSH